jgi:hypothetical protein
MAPILGKTLDGKALAIDVERLIVSRLLVQANSGSGKSYAIRRLLEQTHGKVQQLVLDVEGEFYTLREKHDFILARAGERDRDCAAEPRGADLLARKLLELGVSAVVDIYELRAHERLRFARLFLDALVNAPRELWHPCLVVVDEANVFCPQRGEAESAAAVIDLMTRGRKRGFCGVLATQRLSKLHKDAAAEANNKLIGRSALDVDMERAGDELGFSKADRLKLRTLEPGHFFAFGPALSPEVVEVRIGPVETTHPKPGQRAPPAPAARAKVQKVLGQLADLPKEAEEEARTLADAKATIRKLERELREASRGAPKADPDALAKAVERERAAARREQGRMFAGIAARCRKLVAAALKNAVDEAFEVGALPLAVPASASGSTTPRGKYHAPPPRPRREPVEASGNGALAKGPRAILVAIAQQEGDGATREQLTVLTGYKRSSRDTYLQRLGEKGYVAPGGLEFVATDAGIEALGDFERLPTGSALLEWHRARLPEGERRILEAVAAAYPEAIERTAIDEATDYQRSSRDTYLQRLSARRLVEAVGRGAVRASAMLFD